MIPVTADAVRLLHEGSLTLSRIEANGVRINTEYLDKTVEETEAKIGRLEAEMRADEVYKLWKKRFGERTKLGAREQLAEIVFGKQFLNYEIRGYTDKGRVAAGKDQLDDIDLPFVRNFLLVENLKKTLSTYLIGIRKEMVQEGPFWYVHPFYNLHTASTYRSTCNSINFQNQPKRNPDMAGLLRPCFLPHPGDHFVEIDFSQLEVRIACPYNKDPVLMKYVTDPTTDMHGDMAQEMFLLAKAQVDKKTSRDSAKNQFVFPQFYGSNYVNCAKAIWKSMGQRKFMCGDRTMFEHLASKGIKERGDCVQGQDPRPGTFEAHLKDCEKRMWQKRFRAYTQWKKDWFDAYTKAGGFQMLTGFAVSGLFKRNDVTNYPIQGSAFHCLMWCLIQIDKWLRRYKMKSKIIGEIHDAGQFSVHPSELQDFLNYCHDVMTKALLEHWKWINIPLETETDVGPVDGHWLLTKPHTCGNGKWNP